MVVCHNIITLKQRYNYIGFHNGFYLNSRVFLDQETHCIFSNCILLLKMHAETLMLHLFIYTTEIQHLIHSTVCSAVTHTNNILIM